MKLPVMVSGYCIRCTYVREKRGGYKCVTLPRQIRCERGRGSLEVLSGPPQKIPRSLPDGLHGGINTYLLDADAPSGLAACTKSCNIAPEQMK